MIYYGNKMDVVAFATALQLLSESAWQSTTITRVAKSGVYSVSIATGTLSEDTVKTTAQNYSLQLTNTSPRNTRGGLSLRK